MLSHSDAHRACGGLLFIQPLFQLPTEHVVVADHSPSGDDPENLKLVEGDSVDALDTANPEHWLVCVKATKTEPERLGWVPACYLDPKASPGSAARTSREAFREEVLQITNKQQEATVKRRLVLFATTRSLCILICQKLVKINVSLSF